MAVWKARHWLPPHRMLRHSWTWGGRESARETQREWNNAFFYLAAALTPAEIFIKITLPKAEQTFFVWGAARNLKCRELKVKSPLKYYNHRKRFTRKDFHNLYLFCNLSSMPLSFTRLVNLRLRFGMLLTDIWDRAIDEWVLSSFCVPFMLILQSYFALIIKKLKFSHS